MGEVKQNTMKDSVALIIDGEAWKALEDGRDSIPGSLWHLRREFALDRAENIISHVSAAKDAEIAALKVEASNHAADAETVRRERDELIRANNQLREALKPFIHQMQREFSPEWPDEMDLAPLADSRWHLKVGDFRRAARAGGSHA
ncbi:hypothetical protein CYG48_04830 [Neorhizobium sp. SOG26]|uniref:hypothetical protein n=1 Tax=Neorhizobium sp. SOG26 TaxID=2060726 RepID=UPI000E570813|nr:hypothetical protein [Neorhizobium sp. SOG26]AXV15081.1 hypothetical protein CYG48_04830 [Neorhizobium sp. SOG26]